MYAFEKETGQWLTISVIVSKGKRFTQINQLIWFDWLIESSYSPWKSCLAMSEQRMYLAGKPVEKQSTLVLYFVKRHKFSAKFKYSGDCYYEIQNPETFNMETF